MPCPLCGRIMCDCSPKQREQTQEEMLHIYWNDSQRATKKPPRAFTYLFSNPIMDIVNRINLFKKAADLIDKVKVNIEEIISPQNGTMLLCVAEVYEDKIYCPLHSINILCTDGSVLIENDDRPGEPKLVAVIREWKSVILEITNEWDGILNYNYAVINREVKLN